MNKTVSAMSLSDDDVLNLTELQMSSAEDSKLSRLLDRRQKGKLTADEAAELFTPTRADYCGRLKP
jgi:hypothetical protein